MTTLPAIPDPAALGILEHLEAGVILIDRERRIRFWNGWMGRASGIAPGKALGIPLWDLYPSLRESRAQNAVEDALESGAASILTHSLNANLLPLRLPDGRGLLHNVLIRSYEAAGERWCLVQVNDQTAVADRERVLREHRDARYRAIVDTAPEAIVTTDASGAIQWMNGAAERQFGYRLAEIMGKDIGVLLTDGDAARWPRGEDAAVASRAFEPVELHGRRRDGSTFYVELSVGNWASEGRVFLTGILRDVTERRRAKLSLERALADKTMLLREINHRVKNSLQLVSGLLNLQMSTASESATRQHLHEAAQRISAVARVHHRLYQAERFRTLDFAAFLQELCADLVEASGGQSSAGIRLDVDPVEVGIDQAAPLGLITNELLTNAIKHRGDRPAEVDVTLKRGEGQFTLCVSDNGPGLPPGFDPRKSPTLGLRIITALTSQLSGKLELPPARTGAVFRIIVPQGPPDHALEHLETTSHPEEMR